MCSMGLVCLSLLNIHHLSAQDVGIRYDDFVYDAQIKTVQLYRPEFEFSWPVIELHSDQQLLLTFDDLRGDYRQYNYTIELCDAWWQPVDLQPADYIQGFYEDGIVDYRLSGNTRMSYVHYRLLFPNENLKPTRSGNYILKVWTDDNGVDVVAFTKRFYVLDNKVGVDAAVTAGTNIDTRWYRQEVDFIINRQGYDMSMPFQNLKVVVMQNGRWDNALFHLKPKLMNGDILDYNYDGENSFYGGNEFRNFNIKSLRYQPNEIGAITKVDDQYLVILTPDIKRNFLRYTNMSDINGRYLVKSEDVDDTDTEAEYVYVMFTLLSDAPRSDGEIYLSGSFVNWQYTEETKMEYNYERKAYEATLLLKQGFYDYQYVFLPQGQVIADAAEIEGSHFSAGNEYAIWVYYRQPGEVWDELIGMKFVNSGN